MILKLAWRNIWRNKTRSLVIMTAITLGIVASLFLDAFILGMVGSFIQNSIEKVTSHIQIHNPNYLDDENVENFILNSSDLVAEIEDLNGVKGVTSRTLINSMISSSRTSQNIRLQAIDPALEAKVNDMREQVVDGDFISLDKKNKILISTRLADRLGVKTGAKLVLTFMDMDKEITAGLFRVIGLYNSGNAGYDESNVFILQRDLLRTMDPSGVLENIPEHEIAILLNEKDSIPQILSSLEKKYPDLDIQPYDSIAPELGLYESQMDFITWFYFIIIMSALIFGIVNTMLMAVLERYKEFGVLMSVGLEKSTLFGLILTETIILCLVAAPIGMGAGYLLISFFGQSGINLSMWADFLEQYGMETIIYPAINPTSFYRLTLTLALTAIVAAIYPALKAISLNPLEAIRKI